MSAAQAIREADPMGAVTVISMEPDAPYFRPMIPFLVNGRKRESDIQLMGEGPYTAARIVIRTGCRVTGIDTSGRTISIDNGDGLIYDKLLIATGSRPIIPMNLDHTDAEGVFVFRTLAHARGIARRAALSRHVVMLGGGMLNTKLAFALLELGLDVTMIELETEVLPWLMEADAAALIRNALSKAGLKIIAGSTVSRILMDARGICGVVLDSGRELPCKMLCIGVGVTPNIEFLNKSDIHVDAGVVVDSYTASSIPEVFAAGDVAVTLNSITGERVVTGLWTNAAEMGRCAGFNMAGRPVRYSGALGIMNATQVADVPFVTMGVVHTAGTDYETYVSGSRGSYRKFVFSRDGSKLIGTVLVGDISRAGLYRCLMREGKSAKDIKSEIVGHRLHYGNFIRR